MSKLSVSQPPPLPVAHGLVYAGVAASFAVTMTHPADTVKTRMQLQGEAVRQGGTARYASTADCFVQCARIEGIRGLQRGLPTAIVREFTLNCVRVGLFEPVLGMLHDPKVGSPPIAKRFAAGILTGCCGALVTNPLDLLKTRMQAQASGDNAAVGHQHGYAGVVDGVTRMLREEGIVAMYKVRAILGSDRDAQPQPVSLSP